MKRSRDFHGLLLMYVATGNATGLGELAKTSNEQGLGNIAFQCYWLLGRTEDCLKHLIDQNRIAEAALFARSYLPSHVSRIVTLWRDLLLKSGFKKGAEALADPAEYENLFPDFKYVSLYNVYWPPLFICRPSCLK